MLGCCISPSPQEAEIYAAFLDQHWGYFNEKAIPDQTVAPANLDSEDMVYDLSLLPAKLSVPASNFTELVRLFRAVNQTPACIPDILPTTVQFRLVSAKPAIERVTQRIVDPDRYTRYENAWGFSRVAFSTSGELALLYTGTEHGGHFWVFRRSERKWLLIPEPPVH